jgi:hypothetical protein
VSLLLGGLHSDDAVSLLLGGVSQLLRRDDGEERPMSHQILLGLQVVSCAEFLSLQGKKCCFFQLVPYPTSCSKINFIIFPVSSTVSRKDVHVVAADAITRPEFSCRKGSVQDVLGSLPVVGHRVPLGVPGSPLCPDWLVVQATRQPCPS